MRRRHLTFRWSCAITASLLGSGLGCAFLRKDTSPLPQIRAERIRTAKARESAAGEWPCDHWWRRYHDAQLDDLITRALRDAPAMMVARERLKEGEARAGLAESLTGLVVGLAGSADRERVSRNGFLGPFYHNIPSQGFTGPWYTEGTIGLEGGYTFDPWGKDRAMVQAAVGAVRARQAELAETELLLSCRIAQVYFQYQGTQALAANLERIEALQETCCLGHAAKVRHGLEERSALDLVQAKKLDTEGQIQAARQALLLLREQLRALVGAGPDGLPALDPASLPAATEGPLPALGFELLARRPDLQALRWYVQASLKQVDAARAAFYPSFDLRAFFGFDALHTNVLLQRESRQINVVPGVSLPLFDSHRLNANLARERAQSNTTIAAYNQAVVEAVCQVSQSGIEVEGLGHQLQLQKGELEAVRSAQSSARAKHAQGLVDRVALAEAELPVLVEEAKGIQLRQRHILAEVSLIRTLGGGYRAEMPPKS